MKILSQDTVSTAGLTFTLAEDSSVIKNVGNYDTLSRQKKVTQKAQDTKVVNKVEGNKSQTLWKIFISGIIGGFAALLMPCIFPMLPMTVGFFTKSNKKKSKGVGKAILYGISIIIIYVIVGLLITVFFGADALNSLSTNGLFNFLFFLALLTFAASFFGAFEMVLPSKWVNKIDSNSGKGSFSGIFFMAATLALVSFSCTGPIIGTLLVQAATTGALLGPAIGMFGFALALAMPFTLFAMFPKWMNSLPKSGEWLNSVKVFLGFLELAFSFKFLSNVDLAYHWHLLDREVFLVLWIVIFGMLGLYLLGKLKLSQDTAIPYISVMRLFFAIIVFAFTLFMIPGLWGAPLKSISAFLPPQTSQDFDLYTAVFRQGNDNSPTTSTDNTPKKYADLFDKPLGLSPFFDYYEGVAYAKKVHKPVLIDFTGHACVNCRKMEVSVWSDKEVYQRINKQFVLIQLYVDDKSELDADEQIINQQGINIKTIGNKWSSLQATKFGANSQPFYVLLNPVDESLLTNPKGADYNPASYLKFLDDGLQVYRKLNN